MTPEMQETLDAFLTYFEAHGVAPTVRELTVLTGRRSPARVHLRLHELVERGHLIRLPGKNRNLAPVGPNLRGVTSSDLRAELARREARNG